MLCCGETTLTFLLFCFIILNYFLLAVYICNMYRPSSDTCIDVSRLAQLMEGKLRDVILALHAMSGCDTTAALYGIGKTKLWKLFLKNSSSLHADLHKFYETEVDGLAPGLQEAGIRMLVALYDKVQSRHTDLESIRVWLVGANIIK